MSDATPRTKPKLLVILGAGSSVDLGMPSVKEINGLMRRWAREQAAEMQQTDFYRLVWRNRICHLTGIERGRAEIVAWDSIAPNYERCLADLHAVMNGSMPILFGGRHSLALDQTLGLNHSENPPKELWGKVYGAVAKLLGKLSNKFRERCADFEQDCRASSEFDRYSAIFSALRERFDLGVYNLNHDTVALTALEETYLGFDHTSGCFEAAAVQNRREWNYLYHLHGSVHFDYSDAGEIRWATDIPHQACYQPSRPATEQRWIVPATIIAGGWKLDQLQTEPFQTFYSTLPRHAHEADAILIAGYGFGDEHVNSVLKNVLQARAGHRPPVIVLDYREPKERPLEGERREGHEFVERVESRWQSDVLTKLRMWDGEATLRNVFWRAKRLDQPLPESERGEPVRSKEYAVCFEDAYPVAVWFGGFLAAAERSDEIADWLQRHVPAR